MRQAVLRAVLGAVLLFAMPLLFAAAPDDEPRLKNQIETDLAVQAALSKGQDYNQRGQYQAAIDALEREVTRVSDARIRKEYLAELAKAYRGQIHEFQQQQRDPAFYANRLAILDPGSRLEHAPAPLAAQAMQTGKPEAPKQPEIRGAYDYKKAAAITENDPFSDANR